MLAFSPEFVHLLRHTVDVFHSVPASAPGTALHTRQILNCLTCTSEAEINQQLSCTFGEHRIRRCSFKNKNQSIKAKITQVSLVPEGSPSSLSKGLGSCQVLRNPAWINLLNRPVRQQEPQWRNSASSNWKTSKQKEGQSAA